MKSARSPGAVWHGSEASSNELTPGSGLAGCPLGADSRRTLQMAAWGHGGVGSGLAYRRHGRLPARYRALEELGAAPFACASHGSCCAQPHPVRRLRNHAPWMCISTCTGTQLFLLPIAAVRIFTAVQRLAKAHIRALCMLTHIWVNMATAAQVRIIGLACMVQ